jgi:hypothetical protein
VNTKMVDFPHAHILPFSAEFPFDYLGRVKSIADGRAVVGYLP